jgi:hypothetical protein
MIEASLSGLMVATQQVEENMACKLTTRMAKSGFGLAESSGEHLCFNVWKDMNERSPGGLKLEFRSLWGFIW